MDSIIYWDLVVNSSQLFFTSYLRASIHHGPSSRTMKDGLFPWFDFMVQLPWSNFLKIQFTKPLGPALGVNYM